MKNPYAKPAAKRPRNDEKIAAETAQTSSNELDCSFGASNLDWDEAFKVMDQASQSYEQRQNRSTNTDTQLVVSQQNQSHGESFQNAAAAASENDRKPAAAPRSNDVASVQSSAAASSQSASTNQQKAAPLPCSSAAGVQSSTAASSQPSSVDQQRKPPPRPASDATRTTAPPASDCVNKNTAAARLPIVETTSSVAAAAAPPTHSAMIPRPATWGSSTAAALSAATNKRPSSRNGLVASHNHSTKSLKPAEVPSLSIPRPPTWENPKSTTTAASMPIISQHQGPGSRPSSSHGQAPANNNNNALPPPLNYATQCVQPANDEYRTLLVKNANLSAPLLNGWTLFPHQKKAILRSLLMRRFILALDMGLGKTLIGCVWAKAFQQTFEDLTIIVVCPVSLKKEWKRTAEEATGLQMSDDGDESANMQVFGWSKTPSQVSNIVTKFVVVFDEAHSMQSMTTARTKAALKLVQSTKCVGVLMLTGTPMKNGKPLNLFPLLRAARHPFGDHQKAYETHFCAGHEKSFGNRRVWDANGSSNLVQLRQHVSSHLLYMTKEECLEALPPKTRECRQVPVSSRHQIQHDSALNELAKVYHSTGSLEGSGDLVLTAVQRVRQIGSFAKIDATVAMAKDVLQEQPAVVIFTSFVSVAKAVHKQLSEAGWEGELLTGETPANKRQPMVDNFQAGLSPVFILTFGAGGVGITLTAAHTIILLDRPWTPGDALQAEDRVRRIGQTKPVTSIWMVAFDLDKQIDGVLEQKENTCSVVLQDGEENEAKLSGAPKISVFALLKTLMGSKSTTGAPKASVAAQKSTGM